MNLKLVFTVAATAISLTLLDKPLSGWSADVAGELIRQPVEVSATSNVTATKNADGSTTFKESLTLSEDLAIFPASTSFTLATETASGIEAEALSGLAGFANGKTGTLTLSLE